MSTTCTRVIHHVHAFQSNYMGTSTMKPMSGSFRHWKLHRHGCNACCLHVPVHIKYAKELDIWNSGTARKLYLTLRIEDVTGVWYTYMGDLYMLHVLVVLMTKMVLCPTFAYTQYIYIICRTWNVPTVHWYKPAVRIASQSHSHNNWHDMDVVGGYMTVTKVTAVDIMTVQGCCTSRQCCSNDPVFSIIYICISS